MEDEYEIDTVGCARCEGEGHTGIVFVPLALPFECDSWRFTHWASCPTNGEPILMAFREKT
jgi:hypothetical protein